MLNVMARRIEGQIRNDFAAIPIIRSVCYKWMVEHSSAMIIPFYGQRERPGSIIAHELIEAAQGLCQTLQQGTVTLKSGKKIPVAGDTTRLYQADGLTPVQQRMALNMHFLAKNQPGSQQLRQLMGHCQFGARVVYGDCLFYTLSPNEQHSSVVLRLSTVSYTHLTLPTKRIV